MTGFPFVFFFRPSGRRPFVAIAIILLLASLSAGAANINGNGVSINLPTTDLSSSAAQTNGAGARLVSAGTPGVGVVSTNGAGAKLIIEPMSAIAGNSAPVASFSATPLTGEAPLDVQFTDLSAGNLYAIDAWTWDFGDGSPTSSEQNPKHTYNNPGTHSVSLTITTAGGSPVLTKNDYIVVTQGLPATSYIGVFLLSTVVLLAFGLSRKPGADTHGL